MDLDSNSNLLLRFSLEAIAANANVRSASLHLYTEAQFGGPIKAGVFRANKNWHEQVTTKSHYDSSASLAWDHVLGDWSDLDGAAQGALPFSTFELADDNVAKEVSIDITRIVKAWHTGEFVNFGMMLRSLSDVTATHVFSTKEHTVLAQRPRLEIELAPDEPNTATVELIAQADTYLAGSTYTALGDNPRMEIARGLNAMFRFDISTLTGTAVTRAVLRLYSFAQFRPIDSAGVFAVAKPWSEASASRSHYDHAIGTWDNFLAGDWLDRNGLAQGDAAYAAISLVDDDTGKWVEWDVTSLVQAWADGSVPNHGLMLRFLAGTGAHLFHSREYANPALRPKLIVEMPTNTAFPH